MPSAESHFAPDRDHVIVRPLELADIDQVLAIQTACYRADVIESSLAMQSKQQASPETCFVGEVRGSVEGYLISVPCLLGKPPLLDLPECLLPPDPNCLHLHDMAVNVKSRQLGIGRLLVSAYFEVLRRQQYEQASLIAIQNSASYWERYGFSRRALDADSQSALGCYGADASYMIA